MVQAGGVEPPILSALVSKTSVYTVPPRLYVEQFGVMLSTLNPGDILRDRSWVFVLAVGLEPTTLSV